MQESPILLIKFQLSKNMVYVQYDKAKFSLKESKNGQTLEGVMLLFL